MSTDKDFFKQHNYAVVRNFLTKDFTEFIYNYCLIRSGRASLLLNNNYEYYRSETDGGFNDPQVIDTYSCYADSVMETLLGKAAPVLEETTGLQLAPTYSYWRLYKNGDILERHKDRPSCEISTTLCIGYENDDNTYNWPMWVDSSGEVGNTGTPVYLNPGDMIVYRGEDIEHWREKFQGTRHAQVFLHYNDVNGPYGTTNLFDGRISLAVPPGFREKIQ